MKEKERKSLFTSMVVFLLLSLSLLCLYRGTISIPTSPLEPPLLDVHVRLPFSADVTSFPICDSHLSEHIPCHDRDLIHRLKLKLNLSLMEHYERHCPPRHRRLNCLVPPPRGYKIPIVWPDSRDEVWKANIPHTHLAAEKSDQNWMVVSGDRIRFPGGGTHFHAGADKYITSIAKMLGFPEGNLNNGGRIRNVLDVGCGVASFGAYLLSRDIIAMSLAPNDVHENQIQFALERGIPATLGVLGTKKLPYPSHSFELAHCSRCRINWLQRDGVLLLELDRLLRPGGYFVYSSPEAYAQDEKNRRIWAEMRDLLRRMCWRVVSRRNQTVIFAKPVTNGCYLRRELGTHPPLCSFSDDSDAVWNVPMKACITPFSKRISKARGSELAPWPQRLTAPPPYLEEMGIRSEYTQDMEIWHSRVMDYWKQMDPVMENHTFRNVMDMNANFGGFAAALNGKDVWVMNVVPIQQSSKLKIVYDRGLIGTIHDWCQSFSTYPRTYDLLHAWLVFSEIEKNGCSAEDLLIEMDRILRPHGFVMIRDKLDRINYVRKLLRALRWDGWYSEVDPGVDALSLGEERVLIARKKW